MVDRPDTPHWLGVDRSGSAQKLRDGGYVLREKLASKQQGRPIYYQMPTRIGPCNTSNPRDAYRFASEAEAKASVAYNHPWSSYVVEPAPEVSHD